MATDERGRPSGPGSQRRRKELIWVDTMLGNVKNAIHGTYHAIAHKHLPRYVAEFCWRFNRRFYLAQPAASTGRGRNPNSTHAVSIDKTGGVSLVIKIRNGQSGRSATEHAATANPAMPFE